MPVRRLSSVYGTVHFAVLQYPSIRKRYLEWLESLSDHDYQKQCWVEHNCPAPVEYDCFDFSVSFLFDDTDLGSQPETLLGVCLIDSEEVEGSRRLGSAIDRVLDIRPADGSDPTDAFYIQLPEWQEVLASSISMQTLLRKNDERHGIRYIEV